MVIRNLRTKRGWSQEQLAEVSGVSTRTIQRIENGGKASLESLKCLAAVFETPIPDLQKDDEMPQSSDALTDDDRAALKYARNLKAYGERFGKDADLFDPDMSQSERNTIREVRKLKNFYISLVAYLGMVLFLLIINLLTSPGYLWVVWAALGMGIGVASHAVEVFGIVGLFGKDWEKRQIEKRLRNL